MVEKAASLCEGRISFMCHATASRRNLARKIDNAYGSLKANAAMTSNFLLLSISKVYRNSWGNPNMMHSVTMSSIITIRSRRI